MKSEFLWLASLTSLITFMVHTFVGGIYVARPLLADVSLPKASKWLNYYCWHIATLVILAMSGAYAYAAFFPKAFELAVFVTILAAFLCGLSVFVAILGGIHPLRFPSTSLFAATALFGALSLVDVRGV